MPLTHADWKRALARERLPAALVDLDAFDRNVARIAATTETSKVPVRLASKSVRVRSLLSRALERGEGKLAGIMCYAAREAVFLASHGFKDLLLAYPPMRRGDLEDLAKLAATGLDLTVAVDSRAGADALSQAALAAGTRLRTALCVDMSLEYLGGRVHLGVRRSPLHAPADVVSLARHVASERGLIFHGLVAYEAQVAGLGDASPFSRWMNPVKAAVRRASVKELTIRRSEMVRALKQAGLEAKLVNGGGTGSLDSTTDGTGVTEGTAGSGLFKPHLFDHYASPHMRALEPASFFALEVTRVPAKGFVTCQGGGYTASGAAGPDKLPLPWIPAGLELLDGEGGGEVQTPLRVPEGVTLEHGAPVVFRFAKAGEPMERFDEVLLVRGDAVLERALTYRGEGKNFG